jgi:hypothetical protein
MNGRTSATISLFCFSVLFRLFVGHSIFSIEISKVHTLNNLYLYIFSQFEPDVSNLLAFIFFPFFLFVHKFVTSRKIYKTHSPNTFLNNLKALEESIKLTNFINMDLIRWTRGHIQVILFGFIFCSFHFLPISLFSPQRLLK